LDLEAEEVNVNVTSKKANSVGYTVSIWQHKTALFTLYNPVIETLLSRFCSLLNITLVLLH